MVVWRSLLLFIETDCMMFILLVVQIFYILGSLLILAWCKWDHNWTMLLYIIDCWLTLLALVIYHFQIFLKVATNLWKLGTIFGNVAFLRANVTFYEKDLKIFRVWGNLWLYLMKQIKCWRRDLKSHLQEVISPEYKHLTEIARLHRGLPFNLWEKTNFTKVLVLY